MINFWDRENPRPEDPSTDWTRYLPPGFIQSQEYPGDPNAPDPYGRSAGGGWGFGSKAPVTGAGGLGPAATTALTNTGQGMNWAQIIQLLGPLLGGIGQGLFAQDPFQKREPYTGDLSAQNLLGQAWNRNDALTSRIMGQNISLPDFQAKMPTFAGGGLPMPIGILGGHDLYGGGSLGPSGPSSQPGPGVDPGPILDSPYGPGNTKPGTRTILNPDGTDAPTAPPTRRFLPNDPQTQDASLNDLQAQGSALTAPGITRRLTTQPVSLTNGGDARAEALAALQMLGKRLM